jgi:hypothetical protein
MQDAPHVGTDTVFGVEYFAAFCRLAQRERKQVGRRRRQGRVSCGARLILVAKNLRKPFSTSTTLGSETTPTCLSRSIAIAQAALP